MEGLCAYSENGLSAKCVQCSNEVINKRTTGNSCLLAEQQPVGRWVELKQEPVSPSSD